MKKRKRTLSISQQPKDLSQLGSPLSCFCFYFSWLLWYFDKRKLREEEGRVYSAQDSGTEAAGHIHDIHIWEAENRECVLPFNLAFSSCAAQVPQRDWWHSQWAGFLPQLSQQIKPIASQEPIRHVILVSATLTVNTEHHSSLCSGKNVLLDIQNNNSSRSPKIER